MPRTRPVGVQTGGVADAAMTFIAGAPDKPRHAGHRERLRERFVMGGAEEAMPDYELLELVLRARAISRRGAV